MAVVIRAATPADWQGVVEIFWETTTKRDFADINARVAFQNRYLETYREQCVFVAVDGEEVRGYLVGVTDTLGHPEILEQNPHMALFEPFYTRYPAHLHINCTEEVRGQGVGGLLLAAFESHLRSTAVCGVQLITSATARNVGFYCKNGYAHRVERLWQDRPLLLLGKDLVADNA